MTNTYQSQRTDKLIGVELEFFGVHHQTVVAKLQEAGINVHFAGYTHQTMNGWKLVYDASVTSRGTGLSNGLELVSPPLTVSEMERQLKIVSTVLGTIGAKVDRTCGVHVHHEIDDLNHNHIKNIFAIYAKHQDTIDTMLPKSRRNNHYARHFSSYTLEAIANANSISEIQDYTTSRYNVINFNSYVKYGTVEFRQHAGSYEFDKIFNWILITQAIVESAKAKKSIRKERGATANPTMAFNKEIGIFNTEQGYFVKNRRAHFRKAERSA